MGSIRGIDRCVSGLIANSTLEGKRILPLITCGADPATTPVQEWIEASLPAEMKVKSKVYPLAGKFKYQELSFAHKLMMQISAAILRSEDIKNQIKNPVDNVRKENLSALMDALKT